ncbi:hypothetical protein PHYPSEUDO_005158 [Phytophthora pseudosyringae]|uniref:Uncharacterized protein n=1 Tax=Phytophthora pseudosyringae TaxID=221518 RepID=A0A8T1VQ82_9STRA|nr:hypothetical protein PHYPSEUDO_005158 [Phytophthora pseudosyringae]
MEKFRSLLHERIRKLNDSPASDGQSIESAASKRIRLESADADIFTAYIKELDAVRMKLYWLVDSDSNWDDSSEHWDEDADTDHFKFRGKITFPFAFRDSCRSRWQSAQYVHR